MFLISGGEVFGQWIVLCARTKRMYLQGYTVVHYAVLQGAEKLIETLISIGAPLNMHTRTQLLTPLHIAVRQDRRRIACILAAGGALLDAVDVEGMTPLKLADAELGPMLKGSWRN